ncbi:MAG: hypothetical protein QNK04_02860 [Myxococcota bacterium]|nr:hypothetical protein [Myxococcota bacterium]
MIKTLSAAVLCLLVAGAVVAQAQDVDDVAMKRKVRSLGVAIGNAYACTDAKARDGFNSEAHHLFDLIVQDAGSDLGFVYATAVGYGSSVPKDKLDCPKLMKQWEEIRKDYELAGER